MRQKLTACTVLRLLGCILRASAKERLHFSGSCHFSCTLFSLTFPSLTSLLHHTRCRRKPLHHVHYYATPPSVLIRVLHPSALSTSRSPPTSEIVLAETASATLPAPTALLSPLVTPSCLSCRACKNTCAFQLFVRVHERANAPVGRQSEDTEGKVRLGCRGLMNTNQSSFDCRVWLCGPILLASSCAGKETSRVEPLIFRFWHKRLY